MGKFFDEKGEEVEAFSQEELDAKIQEQADTAAAAAKQKIEDEQKEAADAKKVADDAAAAAAPPAKEGGGPTVTEQLAALTEQINNMQKQGVTDKFQGAVSAFNIDDKEVRENVEKKFEKLAAAGYENTVEGIAQRAKDAYVLVTGQQPDEGISVGDFAAAGGKGMDTKKVAETEADQKLQVSLGITPAMKALADKARETN